MYYNYCIKLRRSSDEFWNSTVATILLMIDMYADEKQLEKAMYNNEPYQSKYFGTGSRKQENVIEVTSMKQIGV